GAETSRTDLLVPIPRTHLASTDLEHHDPQATQGFRQSRLIPFFLQRGDRWIDSGRLPAVASSDRGGVRMKAPFPNLNFLVYQLWIGLGRQWARLPRDPSLCS